MIEFVTFKWKPAPNYRSKFPPSTVNTLLSMLRRNCADDVRLTCITDDAAGIDRDVRIVPLWNDWAHLPSPHGAGYPSCYRRLKLFSDEARDIIGERFVCMDLDVVIVSDITPIFGGAWDFKIWGDTAKGTPYNGSLWELQAGTRSHVWKEFDPRESPKRSLALGYIGSDQGWLGAALGPNEPKWTTRDGVYSYRNHIQRQGYLLPSNARLVIFHGAVDPWSSQAQRLSWVRRHYR